MQFKKDAPVYTADGQQVGAIDRVVLDPQTNDVSHIVIRQGWLFAEDKVLPIALVDTANAERIQLRRAVKNLDALPRFEDVYYIPYETDATDEAETLNAAPPNATGVDTRADAATERAVATEAATVAPTVAPSVAATEEDDSATTTTYTTVTDAFSLYGYPPVGLAWPACNLGAYGYPDELYTVTVKRHIPPGTVALKEGATVVDSQGARLGSIKRIFTNDETDQVTHFLISEGWVFKEQRLIPIDWIKTVTEDEVQLYVKTELLNRLPAYHQ